MSICCAAQEAFYIAWNFLDRLGELGDADASAKILLDSIAKQLCAGERRPLMLGNRAIAAYREQAATGGVAPRRGEVIWII